MSIEINTEADAWHALEQFANHTLPPGVQLEFNNWPYLKIAISGDRYDSSLTPRLMSAFLILHRNMNRAYALGTRGVPDARHLSDEEILNNDFVVRVEHGSSIFDTDLTALAQGLGDRIENVSTNELVALAIIFSLAFCGSTLIKKYFENKKALSEVEREKQRTLQTQEETNRIKILDNAYRNLKNDFTDYQQTETLAIQAHTAIFKAIPDAKSATVAGLHFSRSDIAIFGGEPAYNNDGFPKEVVGDFQAVGLRTRYSDRYFLTLRFGDQRISASFDPRTLDTKTVERVKDAVMNRTDLHLAVTLTSRYTRQINGEIQRFL